jgi:hypothetical protein
LSADVLADLRAFHAFIISHANADRVDKAHRRQYDWIDIFHHAGTTTARSKSGSPDPSATGDRWSARCLPTSDEQGCDG